MSGRRAVSAVRRSYCRVTDIVAEAMSHGRMLFGLPLRSVRRFAAILLLFGAMFAGSVDAVACDPATEMASIEAGVVDQDGHGQIPDNDQHGACMHGHCHHGAQHVPPLASQMESPLVLTVHELAGERRLGSITPDSLKRPPRA